MVLNVHTFFAPPQLYLSVGQALGEGVGIDFLREATSISCVNLFVLISGYFGIKWKAKSIASLIFQVYFWIFLVYLTSIIFITGTFDLRDFVYRLNGLMTGYWFIPCYLGLYIMAPLLNAFVDISSKNKMYLFLIVFYIYQLWNQTLSASNNFLNGYSVLSFCGLYMIGRFISKYRISEANFFAKKWKIFAYIVIVTLIIAISSFLLGALLKNGGTRIMSGLPLALIYNNPFVIIQSILIFIFFLKLNIQNRFINWCAAGALAIYLLHMHPDIKEMFYSYAQSLYQCSLLEHYLSLILLFICVALVALPVDWVRRLTFEKIYSVCSGYLKKCYSKVSKK